MPLDTILLLDTSGSMAGRGITELKRACNTFLDGVEETARQTGLKVTSTVHVISARACILYAGKFELAKSWASIRRLIMARTLI